MDVTSSLWDFIGMVSSAFASGAFITYKYWCPKVITKAEQPCETLVKFTLSFHPPKGFVVKKIPITLANGKCTHVECMKILDKKCTITGKKCYLLKK